MITPVIIQILFWVGVALCIIFGIGYILVGSRYAATGPFYGLMLLISAPCGPDLLRNPDHLLPHQ